MNADGLAWSVCLARLCDLTTLGTHCGNGLSDWFQMGLEAVLTSELVSRQVLVMADTLWHAFPDRHALMLDVIQEFAQEAAQATDKSLYGDAELTRRLSLLTSRDLSESPLTDRSHRDAGQVLTPPPSGLSMCPSPLDSLPGTRASSPSKQPEWTVCPPGHDAPSHLVESMARLPFSHQWELVRFLQPWGPLAWDHVTLDLLESLHETAVSEVHARLLSLVESLQLDVDEVPQASLLELPDPLDVDKSLRWGITFRVVKQCILIEPLRVQMQRSHRMARLLGGDRWLTLSEPTRVASASMLPAIRSHLRVLYIFGRRYEYYFGSSDPFYFAVALDGHSVDGYTPIERLLHEHIPIRPNLQMTFAKYQSRLYLSFSSSVQGMEMVHHTMMSDINTITGVCMTDGCGLISRSALKALAEQLKWSHIPCAIQARCGPCKGVWLADPASNHESPLYLQSRMSQKKYDLLPEFANMSHLRRLDVLRQAQPYPGKLNSQVIRILAHWGVPTQTFLDLQQRALNKLATKLFDPNPIAVQHVLEQLGGVHARRMGIYQEWERKKRSLMDADHEESYEDWWRNSEPEIAIRMFQSGFLPQENEYLYDLLSAVWRRRTKNIQHSMLINLDGARRLLMVPDPTGTLLPNQIFVNINEKNDDGVYIGVITGPALVARNPALIPTDIQKVECVACPRPEFLQYTDVVIMSIQGSFPLAGALGGGDYDGDDCLVIWEPEIVHSFTGPVFDGTDPVQLPAYVDKTVTSSLQVDERTVKDILSIYRELSPDASDASLVSSAMFDVWVHHGFPPIGIYHTMYEQVADTNGLDDKHTLMLATMSAKLIDAVKQGTSVDSHAMKMHTRLYDADVKPDWLAAKLAINGSSTKSGQPTRESQSALGQLYRQIPQLSQTLAPPLPVFTPDTDLTSDYESLKKGLGVHASTVLDVDVHSFEIAMRDIRNNLNTDLIAIVASEAKLSTKRRFRRAIRRAQARIDALPIPPSLLPQGLAMETIRAAAARRLKASCAYAIARRYTDRVPYWPWKLDGLRDTLCDIKASAVGGHHGSAVIPNHVLKHMGVRRPRT